MLLSEESNWVKTIGFSFIILNLYYTARLGMTFANNTRVLNQLDKISLLVFSIVSLGIAFVSLKSRIITQLIDYYKRKRIVFELFIWFLVSRQFMIWILKRLAKPATQEIRGWFLSISIWFVFSFAVDTILYQIKEILARRREEPGKYLSNKARKGFTVGLVLIILIISSYWIYTQIISPLPHYINYDPEYAYLLNSITPFKDTNLYFRMDHPGTLMQLLGSSFHILLSPLSLGDTGSPLLIHVTHPEYLIMTARLFTLGISLWAIMMLAKKTITIHQWPDLFAGLSIPLVYFASHQISVDYLAIWSPNSFNFAFGTTLLLFLFIILTSSEEVDKDQLFLLSTGAGLVATFHVYMITWIFSIGLTIFLYYQLKKQKIIPTLQLVGVSILHSLRGYVIGTLVIIDQYDSFLDWLKDITIHQGVYGRGIKGFPSGNQLATDLITSFKAIPELYITTGLMIFFFAVLLIINRRRIQEQAGVWAVGGGMVVQILVLFGLVMKDPRNRYLLSVAATLPILAASIILIIQNQIRMRKYIYPIFFTFILIGFGANVFNGIIRHQEKNIYYQSYNAEISGFLSDYADSQGLKVEDLILYWTYESYSPCYSLWFGNVYAKNSFINEIIETCKSNYSFNIFSMKFYPREFGGNLNNLSVNSVIIGDPEKLEKIGLRDYRLIYPSNVEHLGFLIPGR